MGDHVISVRCLQPASLTAAAIPEMPVDAESEPLQLDTTPHTEVDSESQGIRSPKLVQPLQLSSESAAKMANFDEIIAQSLEDGSSRCACADCH